MYCCAHSFDKTMGIKLNKYLESAPTLVALRHNIFVGA